MNQVIEGGHPGLLEKRAKLHVPSDTKVASVLNFDRADVRVISLVAKLPILIARTVAVHSGSFVCSDDSSGVRRAVISKDNRKRHREGRAARLSYVVVAACF